MIRKNINGPSWMKIKNVEAVNDTQNKYNFVTFNVLEEDNIQPFESREIPPLSILSIHTKKINGQIAAISCGKPFIII